MDEKQVTLNKSKLSESEFLKKKQELEKKPGVRVVKISEDTYKTELRG